MSNNQAYHLLRCDDLNRFYVSLDQSSYKQFHESLNEYLRMSDKPLIWSELSKGQIIGIFRDRQWHRARVTCTHFTGKTINSKVHCFLVDLAFTVVVNLQNCQQLPSRFRSIKYRAIPCRLGSVTPIGFTFDNTDLVFKYGPVSSWPDAVRRNVANRLKDVTFCVKFQNPTISYDRTNLVDIVLENGQDLGQMLCDEKFATNSAADGDSAPDNEDDAVDETDCYSDGYDDDEYALTPSQFVLAENCVVPSTLHYIHEIKSISPPVQTRLQLFECDNVLLHCWNAIESKEAKSTDFCFIFDSDGTALVDSAKSSSGFGNIRAHMALFPIVCEKKQSNSIIVLPSGECVYETLSELIATCSANNPRLSSECLALDSILDFAGIDDKLNIMGAGGKSLLVLNGFSCLVTTADVLLEILKKLKIESEFVYFVEADRYGLSTRQIIEEYMDALNEGLVSYRFAITKRPRFLFHVNTWTKSCFEWVNSLSSRIHHFCEDELTKLNFGWMFFDCLSVCRRAERTCISNHTTERDEKLVELMSFSISDRLCQTLIVCADDISRAHVCSLLVQNLGGISKVHIIEIRSVKFRHSCNQSIRVIIFYDNIAEPFLSEIISLCGSSDLRHIHFLDPDLDKVKRTESFQCPRLTNFGECKRINCDHRSYAFSQRLLFPLSVAPPPSSNNRSDANTLEKLASLILSDKADDRLVYIRVRNVVNPSCFYGCLMSHRSSGVVFDSSEALTEMDFYFSSNAGSLNAVSLKTNLMLPRDCLYSWKDHGCIFRRVRIDAQTNCAVKLFLLDVGTCETINIDELKLYTLDEKFQRIPANVMEFIICNIKPTDNDEYWPVLAKRASDKLMRGKLVQAQVQMISCSRVWIDQVSEGIDLSSLDVSFADQTIRCKLISNCLASPNPSHLPKLKDLFNFKSQVEPVQQQQLHLTCSRSKSFQLGTVKIIDGSVVQICGVNAKRRMIFVHLCDMLPKLKELNMHVQNLALVSESCDIESLVCDDLCLVKVSSESIPCTGQQWYRARKHVDEAFTLIDFGRVIDQSVKPSILEIKEYNLYQLQTVALCTHISTNCYDFIGSEMQFMEEVLDQEFVVMDAEFGHHRLLSTKAKTELVDIGLSLLSVWPNEQLLDAICSDDWAKYVGNFRSLVTHQLCMNDKCRWAAALEHWGDLETCGKRAVVSFVSFSIVLSWKFDKHLSIFLIENIFNALIGFNCLRDGVYLLISHCIRSVILENKYLFKRPLTCCLLRIVELENVLELDARPERIVSLFRAAISLSHDDADLAKSVLNLIPTNNRSVESSVKISFDEIDSIRTYMQKNPPSSDIIHLFKQCIFKLESSLAYVEDEQEKLANRDRRPELVDRDSSSSDGKGSGFSSDDEHSSSSAFENQFFTNLTRVLKEGMKVYDKVYNSNGSSKLSQIVHSRDNVKQDYLNPKVLWYQDDDKVILTIDKVGKCSVLTDKDTVQFRLYNSDPNRTTQRYGFDLQLYDCMKNATYSQRGHQTRIEISKANRGEWPRLQKADKRPLFVIYDPSKLTVDDDLSEDVNDNRYAGHYESESTDSEASSDGGEPSHYNERRVHYED